METFSALLAICAGNSPVPGEFPAQRPVTRSFDVSFDLRPNKRLSKQWWGWWFETISRPLWRHRNVSIHWLRGLDVVLKLHFSILIDWLVFSFLMISQSPASNIYHKTLYWPQVNIGWGNGLVPSGNKALPELMLISIYVVLLRH